MTRGKVFILIASALIVLAASAFASCSKDDDAEQEVTLETLGGDYVGSATGTVEIVSSTGSRSSIDIVPQGTETANVALNEDGSLTIKQPTFYTESKGDDGETKLSAYPGAIVYNLPVNSEEGNFSFVLKEYSGMNGYYTVAGTFSGKIEGKKLILDYTFLHAGQIIGTVHYEGTKK
ncbi:MAG: hypothetical protein GXY64_07785 [Bacteroidales bacterium]|nr:hypothetical protein [Bacteroidales bacterium]